MCWSCVSVCSGVSLTTVCVCVSVCACVRAVSECVCVRACVSVCMCVCVSVCVHLGGLGRHLEPGAQLIPVELAAEILCFGF